MSAARFLSYQRYLVPRLASARPALIAAFNNGASRAMFSTVPLEADDFDDVRVTPMETIRTPIEPRPQYSNDNAPLPRTLVQALEPTKRAVVVVNSKPPYRVFNVNCAWQKLCGYSLTEARHYTLGSLLSNSEINSVKAKDLVEKIMQGENEVEATLVNYKKCGQRFLDHIRIGPILDKQGKLTHFVGVVEEVSSPGDKA